MTRAHASASDTAARPLHGADVHGGGLDGGGLAPDVTAQSRPGWLTAVSTVLRVGLAGVWIVAGALKVGDPDGMVRSVRAFRVLPELLVTPVAHATPFVEIALGVLLLVGLGVRAGAVVSALLFAVYIAAIAAAAARGLRIDCGCFSAGGDLTAGTPTRYTSEIVRDSLLLVASLALLRWPRTCLAVDRALGSGESG